ncbi:MAG: hypothetical protein CXT67_00195 [Methanobacteriota archaeon]|jgi:hypothetical protein|nr:MAG: hypothetical protein CXT67_00195 [Euryarchaeota archaeon]
MNALSKDELDIIKAVSTSYITDKSWSFTNSGLSLTGDLFPIIEKETQIDTGMYFLDKMNALKYTLMLPMLAEKHGATGFDPLTTTPYTREWNPVGGVEILKNIKTLEPHPLSTDIKGLTIGTVDTKSITIQMRVESGIHSKIDCDKLLLTAEGKVITMIPKLCAELLNLHSVVSRILETTDDEKVKQLLAPFDYAELDLEKVKENVV